jgi:hypothetical protein
MVKAAAWHLVARKHGESDLWLDGVLAQLTPEQRKEADALVPKLDPGGKSALAIAAEAPAAASPAPAAPAPVSAEPKAGPELDASKPAGQ